jgi:hypothetical protein
MTEQAKQPKKNHELMLKLTADQQKQLAHFITSHVSRADVDIVFEQVDIEKGSIAASTFLVGAAV